MCCLQVLSYLCQTRRVTECLQADELVQTHRAVDWEGVGLALATAGCGTRQRGRPVEVGPGSVLRAQLPLLEEADLVILVTWEGR